METIALPPIDVTLPTDTATIYDIDISQFPRAQEIAANYQFYRPKFVKFVYEPLFPLGTNSSMAAVPLGQKMNFYYIMNRQGNVPNAGQGTLNWLIEQGAKPIPFGDSRAKNIVVQYRPNLLMAFSETGNSANAGVATNTTATGIPAFNRWVNTYELSVGVPPNNVNIQNTSQQWNGHFVIIEPSNTFNFTTTGTTAVANVKVTVEWQFKLPYLNDLSAPPGGPMVKDGNAGGYLTV